MGEEIVERVKESGKEHSRDYVGKNMKNPAEIAKEIRKRLIKPRKK